MVSTKVTIKDEWFNVSTGILDRSEISTETLYASTNDELNSIKEEYINSRIGSYEHDNIKHTSSLVKVSALSKEEMFDFILDNTVNCTISNSNWTDKDGNVKNIKYKVTINNVDYGGFDLEEAIQHYHDNYRSIK